VFIVMTAVVAAFFGLQRLVLRGKGYGTLTGRGAVVELNRSAGLCRGLAAYTSLVVLLPTLVLLSVFVMSFARRWSSSLVPQQWTLAHYERVFGRPIEANEWSRIDDVFHDAYRAALAEATLAHDAERALDALEDAGMTQSLLSMWRHEELVPLVSRLGIADRFARIDGLPGVGGGAKAPFMEEHLAYLVADPGVGPDDVVVVGDALDDAAAAAHVGARCVLYDGGSHPRSHLEAAGVPVASTLTEALHLAGLR
jgi:phosphoglycolate phosphatase-like HAD superfamily hydrolase